MKNAILKENVGQTQPMNWSASLSKGKMRTKPIKGRKGKKGRELSLSKRSQNERK